MKTKLLLAFIILCGTTNAQTWFQQASGTDSTLQDVHFISPNIGFVCGVSGTVLKTINGGANWNPLATGVTDGFNVIRFLNADTGFVGGAHNGTLLKTTNGGSTWNNIGPNMLNKNNGGMWFTSADTGFIAIGSTSFSGSKILKTHNGGVSWDTVYTGANWISYFYFSDASHGWATASNSNVLKTTDGGNNWSVLNVGINVWMSGVYFFDPNNGFVGGGFGTGSGIWKTSDGGSNWQQVDVGHAVSKISFADANTVYAINALNYSPSGTLIKSINGGNNWNDESTPIVNLIGLFFTNTNNGYAVGENGVILKYGITTSIKNNVSYFGVSVYPNPFNNFVTLQFNSPVNNAELNICNLYGQKVKTINHVSGENIKIDRDDLPSGIYFIRLTKGNETIASDKLIITD